MNRATNPAAGPKTRVVQELYGWLAAERQAAPRYWPSSVQPGGEPGGDPGKLLDARRNRVYPESVEPPEGSVLEWFWWGIACASRAGTPMQALADDLTQVRNHSYGLEARWKQLAPLSARFRRAVKRHGGEVGETVAGEVVSAAAGTANLAVPGLGLLVLAVKWGVQSVAAGDDAPATIDATGGARTDLVGELAPAVTMLTSVGCPVVVVVEDLHLADESLVELLARLLATASESPLLVVTTAHRGLLDEPDLAAHDLLGRVPAERSHRVLCEDTVGDLAVDDRVRIVEAVLATIDAQSAARLANKYPNPYALQLACQVPAIRRAAATGVISRALTDGLPHNIEGLFRLLWDELPEDVRAVLMLGAIAAPAQVSVKLGFGDRRWDAELLGAASATVGWLAGEVGDLRHVLLQSSDVYAWVRTVDEWLRKFHDLGQHELAAQQADGGGIGHDERAEFYRACAAHLAGTLDDEKISPAVRVHGARLLVALASERFIDWDDAPLRAARLLCSLLAETPGVDELRSIVALTDAALTGTDPSNSIALALRSYRFGALAELGRVDEAIGLFEMLLADQIRVLGADHPDTLTTRNNIASWYGRAGRVDEAIGLFEVLLADQIRVLGADHPDTLATRAYLDYLRKQREEAEQDEDEGNG